MKITAPQITDFPLYTSAGGFRSLWQKYLIFRDRLVLKTLVKTMTIPLEDIEKVEIHPPNIRLIFSGEWFSKKFTPAIKIDIADFYEHLAVYRKSGVIRITLFTPDNVKLFKDYLERALESFRRDKKR